MKSPNSYISRPSGDDPRSTEAWALGEASRRLALAARMNDQGEALREALRLNRRLWSIFQAAISEPDCPLPKAVRKNVLALSMILDRHVMARLADLDGTKIKPILDINRAISEGLSMNSAQLSAGGSGEATPAEHSPSRQQAEPASRIYATAKRMLA